MPKKPTFSEPGCWSCPHYAVIGQFPCETRLCMGTRRKRGTRFRKSDPQYKPPKWCPRRLTPKTCRVYSLRGEPERLLEQARRVERNPKKHESYAAFEHRYDPEPRYEKAISMTAKQFYEQANQEKLEEILEGYHPECGDVIGIDGGLHPYLFYYYGFARVLPVLSFRPPLQNR